MRDFYQEIGLPNIKGCYGRINTYEEEDKFIEGKAMFDGLASKYSFSPTNHDGLNIADLVIAYSIRRKELLNRSF